MCPMSLQVNYTLTKKLKYMISIKTIANLQYLSIKRQYFYFLKKNRNGLNKYYILKLNLSRVYILLFLDT